MEKQDKKKVLIINDVMQYGGSDLVAVRLQQHLDPDKFECVYCLRHDEIGPMELRVAETGIRILHQPDTACSYIKSYFFYKRLLKREHFDIVHCHLLFYSGIALFAAKRCGVKKRIAHAHFSQPMRKIRNPFIRLIKNIYHVVMRWFVSCVSTDIIGCSQAAGEYLAGRRGFSRKGTILNNGVVTEQYCLNDATRQNMRNALGLNDKIILGHCGQLHDVKNQMLLLDVFHLFHQRHHNSALILVGDGQDRQQLERKIKQLQLSKCARILGFRNDVPQLLMAMDCFVFPSIHEGFPLTLVEAQAAQLPCVVSDTITPTVKLTEALQFASIEAQPEEWSEKIEAALQLNRREISIDRVIQHFDIDQVCKKLEQIYLRK